MGNFMLDRLIGQGRFRRTLSFPRRRDGFHIMATSVGYEMAEAPAYDWNGRERGHTPFSVLQHTVAGRGRLRYEKRDFTIERRQTMLVSIPHAHRYWVEPGERWSFFWIAMSGRRRCAFTAPSCTRPVRSSACSPPRWTRSPPSA